MNLTNLISRLNKLKMSIEFDPSDNGTTCYIRCSDTNRLWAMKEGPDPEYAMLKALESCKHPDLYKVLGVI